MVLMTHERMKAIQITLIISSGMCGLLSGILLGKIYVYFQNNCIFYANVSVDINWAIQQRQMESVSVGSRSVWGTSGTCKLVNFEGILVFIHSFIWLWFYIHMDNVVTRKEMSDHALRKLLVSGCYPVSRCLTTTLKNPTFIRRHGYEQFCSNLCSKTSGLSCHLPSDGCQQLQMASWIFLSHKTVSQRPFAFHDTMQAVIILSSVEAVVLAIQVLVILADICLLAYPMKSSGEDISSDIRISQLWDEQQSDTGFSFVWSQPDTRQGERDDADHGTECSMETTGAVQRKSQYKTFKYLYKSPQLRPVIHANPEDPTVSQNKSHSL